ncbi:hypothetical protein BASA62_001534 [Batrachochytrium salamandrivorans]|nr:hypothetical protein BASA62_001534 [Batrachochytrium salamandrivorans]
MVLGHDGMLTRYLSNASMRGKVRKHKNQAGSKKGSDLRPVKKRRYLTTTQNDTRETAVTERPQNTQNALANTSFSDSRASAVNYRHSHGGGVMADD